MYTDGETYYYRNDRPTRPPAREPERSASYEATRHVEAALADRLARLEAAVVRLEESITQFEGLVQQTVRTRPEQDG